MSQNLSLVFTSLRKSQLSFQKNSHEQVLKVVRNLN